MATFAGSEGHVHYERWAPEGPPDRIVIIVHGYAEYAARYGRVADALTASGAIVYGQDHLGHGHREGERALIVDFEHVVDDLRSLLDIAVGEHPGLSVVMVGHSMGGLLSARFAQRYPEQLVGIVFLGAVIGDWHWARGVAWSRDMPEKSVAPWGSSGRLYEGARHELVNETNRDEVIAEIVDFVHRVTSA